MIRILSAEVVTIELRRQNGAIVLADKKKTELHLADMGSTTRGHHEVLGGEWVKTRAWKQVSRPAKAAKPSDKAQIATALPMRPNLAVN
jgi:hypothetical protein